VESTLVVGVDRVVGANLAVSLSGLQPVYGVALSTAVADEICEHEVCDSTAAGDAIAIAEQIRPQRIVYAGVGSDSCWAETSAADWDDALSSVLAWLVAADAVGAQFTLISSDAIFTGPWMFHAENSQSICGSPRATILRQIEEQVGKRRPDSLIVRTNAFGWSPLGDADPQPWLEALVSRLQLGQRPRLDCLRHGSPILATDLAQVLAKAWRCGLTGPYHIAGSERVNPLQFARRLAHQFALPFVADSEAEALTDRVQGFGRGETSLQTRKVRRALGIGLPLVSEGIQRMYEQYLGGHRDRIRGRTAIPESRVA
jgi:dTDP-4-dehydrorhamnose reductase